MLLAGLAGSLLSYLGCALTASVAVFVAARVLLGASAALSIPAALALLTDTFSDDADRRRALAVWSALGGVGSTAGMLLGGLVTAGLGWRWLFAASAAVCLPLLLLAASMLTEPAARPHSSHRLDGRGLVYCVLGVAGILYAASDGASGQARWVAVGVGAIAVALLVAFGARQSRIAHPLVSPHLLRLRAVRTGNVTILVTGILVDGLLYTLSLLLQDLRGYSALQYGAVAAVMTGCSAVAAGAAQHLCARFGAHQVAIGGLIGLAATALTLLATEVPGAPLLALVGSMVLFGAAMGAAFVGGSIESLRVADERDNATAGAVQNISFTLGTVLGVALVTAVATSVGHLGTRPLSLATPTQLLSGLRAALWGEAGVSLAGAAVLAIDRLRSSDSTGVVMPREECRR